MSEKKRNQNPIVVAILILAIAGVGYAIFDSFQSAYNAGSGARETTNELQRINQELEESLQRNRQEEGTVE